MTFPTVARIRGQTNPAGTSHNVTFSGLGTVSNGDGILIVFAKDGQGVATFPGGWTSIVDAFGQSNAAGHCHVHAVYATMAGGETGITVTSASQVAAWSVFKFAVGTFTAWATSPPEASVAVGGTANPDSPSETASWGSDDNWWLAWHGCDSARTTSVWPTSTTDQHQVALGTAMGHAAAERYDTALTTWDPSAFTISTADNWAAATIVVRPAAGAAATSPPPRRGTPQYHLIGR